MSSMKVMFDAFNSAKASADEHYVKVRSLDFARLIFILWTASDRNFRG